MQGKSSSTLVLVLANIFYMWYQKTQTKWAVLHQTEILLDSKANNQNEKETCAIWENIYKPCIWWGVTIQNIFKKHKS
jgi:hypothetical protein